jgi:hypothetical protein
MPILLLLLLVLIPIGLAGFILLLAYLAEIKAIEFKVDKEHQIETYPLASFSHATFSASGFDD